MSKTKNKNRNEIEHYKGEIRRLKRQLRELQKSKHLYDDIIDASIEQIEEPRERVHICQECGKGKIKYFSVLDIPFEECDICDYRKKLT